MLLRLAVFAMMGLGLLGFSTVAWLALRPPPAAELVAGSTAGVGAPAPLRHTVIAAAGPLRAGTLLKPEDLAAREVTDLPPGAQDDTSEARAGLVGAMLRRNLQASEPVIGQYVIRPGDHGFLAAVLAPGRRTASVSVDAVSGSAGLIWPGDHVDLILTESLDDPDLPPGHRIAAEMVLSDVRVLAIDQLLAHGVAPPAEQAGLPRTVTLEVTGAEAERVAVATRLGKLSLSVRAEGAPSEPPVKVLTTWGGDVSPALSKPAPAAAGKLIRIFQGDAEAKEYRF